MCSFRYIFAFTFGAHSSIQWTRLSCFLFEFSLETTPQIFHTASNWLTLALAVQRYIYVCNPALAKRCCTLTYARVLVMGTVVVAVMHMVPRTLDREYSIHDVGKNLLLVCYHTLPVVLIYPYYRVPYVYQSIPVTEYPMCINLSLLQSTPCVSIYPYYRVPHVFWDPDPRLSCPLLCLDTFPQP